MVDGGVLFVLLMLLISQSFWHRTYVMHHLLVQTILRVLILDAMVFMLMFRV